MSRSRAPHRPCPADDKLVRIEVPLAVATLLAGLIAWGLAMGHHGREEIPYLPVIAMVLMASAMLAVIAVPRAAPTLSPARPARRDRSLGRGV